MNLAMVSASPSMASFNDVIIVAPFLKSSVANWAAACFNSTTQRVALFSGGPAAALAAMVTCGFGTTTPAYLKASTLFSQNPAMQRVYIGRQSTGGDGSESCTTALTAIATENNNWYGLIYCDSLLADQELIAAWVQSNVKLYVTASADPNCITNSSADIITYLNTNSYYRTRCFYDPLAAGGASGDDNVDAAMMGWAMPQQPGKSNWAYATLVGATPLSGSNALDGPIGYVMGKGGDVYITVSSVNIVREGYAANGQWPDVTWGLDWMQARIQQRIFTALVQATQAGSKIGYSDVGIRTINAQLMAGLQEAVTNQILQSFTTTPPLASSISAPYPAERILPSLPYTGKLFGAIDSVVVNGVVTY
jgi:hypothetical protein